MTWADIDRVLIGFYELYGQQPAYLAIHAAEWAGLELEMACLARVPRRNAVRLGDGRWYCGVEVRPHGVEKLRGLVIPGPPVRP